MHASALQVLESSRAENEPTSFEVGAGDVVGNNIFQAFDEAVRGLAVGDKARIKVRAGQGRAGGSVTRGWRVNNSRAAKYSCSCHEAPCLI